MPHNKYKRQISSFIEDMVADGADPDQVLNALTRCTLSFMKKVRRNHRENRL